MSTPPVPALLPGVDQATFAVALTQRLRSAGAAVDLSAGRTLVAALAACPPTGRTRLYWTCRVALVRRAVDLPVFDAVFAAAFDDAMLAMDPLARRADPPALPPSAGRLTTLARSDPGPGRPGGPGWRSAPAVVEVHAQPAQEAVQAPQPAPSPARAALDIPFDRLDPDQLRLLQDRLAERLAGWPSRRSRRTSEHPRGAQVDVRATLHRSRSTGFEPVHLLRRRPVRRPRRLVLVCDVSASMRGHAGAYLHLARAVSVLTSAEVFAFSTRLTRLTPALRHSSPEVALRLAGRRCQDRFAGTRIATSLAELVASQHGDLLRGAVLVIASDGWDADPPEAMSAVMARLARRAHRVVWLNPRAAAPGYRPLAGGMAAALPYCDRLMPAHTTTALVEVVDVLAGFSRSR